MRLALQSLLLYLVVIVFFVQVAQADDDKIPPTPVFATNYRVSGVLSLPYAELDEPFTGWYDKDNQRSRTDYYDDLYKIYQFGPKSSPVKSDFGAMFKMVYVPDDIHDKGNTFDKIRELFHLRRHPTSQAAPGTPVSKTVTRRACFTAGGSVGGTIQPQTVLPNLVDFTYESTGKCPHANFESSSKCELWKLILNEGEKKNTYKMWVKRNEATGEPIPVHYYMLGYNSLLGSHYDRYDVSYFDYKVNGASDSDFEFDPKQANCGSMPGPGDNSSSGQRRSHMIVQNPIHEYVTEPHNYDHIDHEFSKFVENHGKEYSSQEHQQRSWHNFLHNFRFINSKNRQLKDYKLGINSYADNNVKELSYLRGRLRSTGYNGGLDYAEHHKLKNSNKRDKLPDYWDWSILGAVTPVKDQAVCGSCWSFGTSGTIEGAYFVKTGKLPRLSQQQMVDCSWKFGNNGCDGGEDFRAYQYIMDAGGLATEEDYGHYLGVDGMCHDKDINKAVKISGFYNVTENDPEALKHAIKTYGPVTVAIDASRPTFTFYSHGVYSDPECSKSPDGLDHQVLAVGYVTLNGKLAWLVKNSWSTNWGNAGYILMAAENNVCGLMDSPTVPIIKI